MAIWISALVLTARREALGAPVAYPFFCLHTPKRLECESLHLREHNYLVSLREMGGHFSSLVAPTRCTHDPVQSLKARDSPVVNQHRTIGACNHPSLLEDASVSRSS